MEFVYSLYLFCVIIGIVTTLIAYHKFGFFFNHYFFYNFTWLLLIYLSLFYNSYRKPVSAEVYGIFLVGLMCFDSTIVCVKKKNIKLDIDLIKLDIRKRRILEYFVILGIFPAAYLNYTLIQSGVELYRLNEYYWATRGEGTYLYQQFQQLFLSPMTFLLVSTSFYNNYSHSNRLSSFLTFILAFFISIEYLIMTGGGRHQMMNLFFAISLSVIGRFHHQMRKCLFSPSKYFYIFIGIAIIILIQWANEGRGKSNSFVENAINGYIIFPPLFEYYLNQTDIFTNNTYGGSMFEFFVTTLQYPLKLLGVSFYEEYNNDIVQNFVYVYKLGEETNAQVSTYFYFFRDFGYLGIFIGPMLTAGIFNWLYSLCRKNTFYLLFFLCAVLKGCLSSGFPFDKGFYFAFLYLILVTFFFKERNVQI